MCCSALNRDAVPSTSAMLHVFREVLGGYTALPGEIRSLRSDLNEVWAIRPRIFPKEDQRKKPVGPRSPIIP
jgi:hypothetical protein